MKTHYNCPTPFQFFSLTPSYSALLTYPPMCCVTRKPANDTLAAAGVWAWSPRSGGRRRRCSSIKRQRQQQQHRYDSAGSRALFCGCEWAPSPPSEMWTDIRTLLLLLSIVQRFHISEGQWGSGNAFRLSVLSGIKYNSFAKRVYERVSA